MNTRERIIATMQRKKPDRIPCDIWATPEVISELKNYLGVVSEQAIWQKLGIDKIVNLTPLPLGVPVTGCYTGKPMTQHADIWGVEYFPKSYADGCGVYWEICSHPLKTLDTIESIEQNYLGTGYIVAPCHNIQPITPMENIVTLYKAVHHYGVL